ncbi:hypothetical protein [Amycolatopsis benzoatilytica]|uniref:hypothetical protein n=1 Tax=Amycolatopsis benzoatilytica TaxID=346045 RepID=UPI00037F6EFA|nr:hypothetical protein [Amycolatopsis benzoatilytica]
MPSEPESAPAAFTRAGQDAVTFSRRVASTALARSERRRKENRELLKEFGRRRLSGAAPVPPSALGGAARRFRAARGLPMPSAPQDADPVPVRPQVSPEPTRTSDEDEDFSQLRIMRRPL